MHFSKFSLPLLLSFTSTILAQVIVTVTNTVTVVTVTASPLTTSTSTKYVTVTGGNIPATTSKTTKTVVVTSTVNSVPSSAGCSVAWGGQCSGDYFTGCKTCASGLVCYYFYNLYSQCLDPNNLPHSSVAQVATSTVYINAH